MGFFDWYPYTNWHNINLDWVLERVKEWGELVLANDQAFRDLQEANEAFKEYVRNYLQDLDVQEEINIKLDNMLQSGELTPYMQPFISTGVTEWLEENITQPVGVVIDSSLTVEGACADAKATGDAITATQTYELIPNNADLNNYDYTGKFTLQTTSYTISNFPERHLSMSLLDVNALESGRTAQRLYIIGTGRLYTRWKFAGGSWSDWVTSDLKDYVTPQMFGAKADGVTDDTEAFRSAIASGRNIFVPLSNGQRYLITDTIEFPKVRQAIFGDLYNLDWSFFGTGSLNGCIYFRARNKVLFDFKQIFDACANLAIFTDEGSGNTAIRFARNVDRTNMDASVTNCSIRNFDISVDYYGRGFAFHRNAIISTRIAVRLTLTNDPQWNHNNPTSAEIFQTYPEYNGRSLYITNNRFHLVSERYLQVRSEDYTDGTTTLKQVLNGAIFSNNMSDLGYGSFEFNAPIKGCIFTGNEFLRITPDVFFNCLYGCYNCSITGNTIRGLNDTEFHRVTTLGKDCFVFSHLENTTITGNVIENFKGRCISCYPESFSYNTVIGNIFNNYGMNASGTNDRTGVDLSDSEYSIISNNTFMTGLNYNGYMIKCRDANSNVWKGNVFNGNTSYNRTSQRITVPSTPETEDNIIQS